MGGFTPNSSGMGTFAIGGVIILILVAVGFSSMSTNFFQASSVARLNEERIGRIHDRGVHIDQSRLYLAKQKRYLEEQEALLEPAKEAARIQAELDAQQAIIADLQLESTGHEEEIEEISRQRVRYRDQVRAHIWPRYLEQELKAGNLAGAMDFKNPKIRAIDPAGLMVSHDSGASRIKVSELSLAFREELALDVEEAAKVMTDILVRDALIKRSRSQRAAQAAQDGQPTSADLDGILNERLEKGIIEVERYFNLIQVADKTAEVARYNDRYSSSRSLPGKLETWASRAQKFEAAAANYRRKFNAALSEVLKIDPDFKLSRK